MVVKLMVEDVNDHPPVFLQPRYEARIHENAAAFPEPLVVSALPSRMNKVELESSSNPLQWQPNKMFPKPAAAVYYNEPSSRSTSMVASYLQFSTE